MHPVIELVVCGVCNACLNFYMKPPWNYVNVHVDYSIELRICNHSFRFADDAHRRLCFSQGISARPYIPSCDLSIIL